MHGFGFLAWSTLKGWRQPQAPWLTFLSTQVFATGNSPEGSPLLNRTVSGGPTQSPPQRRLTSEFCSVSSVQLPHRLPQGCLAGVSQTWSQRDKERLLLSAAGWQLCPDREGARPESLLGLPSGGITQDATAPLQGAGRAWSSSRGQRDPGPAGLRGFLPAPRERGGRGFLLWGRLFLVVKGATDYLGH